MRVSNNIRVPTTDTFHECLESHAKNNLVFNNPAYLKKQQMGLWLGNTPEKIRLYNSTETELCLPFGLLEKCFEMGCKFEQPNFPDIPILAKSEIVARNYQQYGIDAIKKYKNGLLLMFAGSGKTQTALQAACDVGQKTLWITHTQDLIIQAKTRAEDNITLENGTSLITEGICDTSGDIVFATVQTLVKFVRDESVDRRCFGMVIVDECHRVLVNAETLGMFQSCIEYFECRYKVGLTATDHRSDGMFDAVKAIIGNALYEMVRDDVKEVFSCQIKNKEVCTIKISEFQVQAIVHQIKTGYNIADKHELFSPDGGTVIFSKLITDLTQDKNRNELILQKLLSLKDRHTLIVSDRLEQLSYLCSQVENAVFVDGKTKKSIREQAIQDMRDCKKNYLFGTWKLVKEGLDIPCIDNIVFASPNKDYAIIVQCVGRGQRPFEGKDVCDVWDYCDTDCGMLKGMMYKRNSVYKKNGIKICRDNKI